MLQNLRVLTHWLMFLIKKRHPHLSGHLSLLEVLNWKPLHNPRPPLEFSFWDGGRWHQMQKALPRPWTRPTIHASTQQPLYLIFPLTTFVSFTDYILPFPRSLVLFQDEHTQIIMCAYYNDYRICSSTAFVPTIQQLSNSAHSTDCWIYTPELTILMMY